MKIFSPTQIRKLDALTMKEQEISSWELMERAARSFFDFLDNAGLLERGNGFAVLCGTGNNGGDGMAVARMLAEANCDVQVFILPISGNESEDFRKNKYLAGEYFDEMPIVESFKELTIIEPSRIIIDAVLGIGLNRPLDKKWQDILSFASILGVTRISIDIPSGLYAEQLTEHLSFSADITYTFQTPKLAFFQVENQNEVGEWYIGDIDLDEPSMIELKASNHYISSEMANFLLRNRKRHDHKGTFGHALLIAGSYGKVGAATLAAQAILRAGAGLVTVHAPRCAYQILQIGFPEAMVSIDKHEFVFSEIEDLSKYDSIGIGPGLGTNELTIKALSKLLKNTNQALVLDADALNIISAHPELWEYVPENSILTPHPKEAERLFGKHENSFTRIESLKKEAKEKKVFIVLKGGNTAIFSPEGSTFFNNTGNPGMATGGSGDVLTGVISGLLAQGYASRDAAILGVYLHGLAGDIAMLHLEHEALIASDIISNLGLAFQNLKDDY